MASGNHRSPFHLQLQSKKNDLTGNLKREMFFIYVLGEHTHTHTLRDTHGQDNNSNNTGNSGRPNRYMKNIKDVGRTFKCFLFVRWNRRGGGVSLCTKICGKLHLTIYRIFIIFPNFIYIFSYFHVLSLRAGRSNVKNTGIHGNLQTKTTSQRSRDPWRPIGRNLFFQICERRENLSYFYLFFFLGNESAADSISDPPPCHQILKVGNGKKCESRPF